MPDTIDQRVVYAHHFRSDSSLSILLQGYPLSGPRLGICLSLIGDPEDLLAFANALRERINADTRQRTQVAQLPIPTEEVQS